jgi:tetratricopeptide (TPR) repeat protein
MPQPTTTKVRPQQQAAAAASYVAYQKQLEANPHDTQALFNLAPVLLTLGNGDSAWHHITDTLHAYPTEASLYTQLADVALAIGHEAQALALLEQLPQSPLLTLPERVLAEVRLRQALAHHGDTDQHQQASRLLNDMVQRFPHHVGLCNQQALLLLGQGQWHAAAEAFHLVTQLDPTAVSAWLNKAVALGNAGSFPQAEAALDTALDLAPTEAEVWLTLATVAKQAGHWERALMGYDQADALTPHQPELLFNKALALQALNRSPEAIETLQQVLALDETHHEAATLLVSALLASRQYDEALALANTLTQRFSTCLTLKQLQAQLLDECGYTEQAQRQYQHLLLQRPADTHLRLALGRLYPIIAQHADEYDRANDRLAAALRALSQAPPLPLNLAPHEGGEPPEVHPPFTMAYQPANLRWLRQTYADTLARALHPYARYQQLPLAPKPDAWQDKLHVGWLVTRHHEAIFTRLMSGLAQALPKKRVALTVIAPEASLVYLRQQPALAKAVTSWVKLPNNLLKAVQHIKTLGLDALHFYEVGTDTENYLLPWFKLAPLQMTGWGFPVTSGWGQGLLTVASCAAFEGDDADTHYSEPLLRLPGPPGVFTAPHATETRSQWRYRLGLSEVKVMGCLQNLFKLHPHVDALWLDLLNQNPKAVLLLLEGMNPHWRHHIMQRLGRTWPNHALDRVLWLPRQSPQGYINALAGCDVVLDPLYYGGGSSSLEALGVGTPVVTWPSGQQRSRHTTGFYQLAQHPLLSQACVATSAEAFCQQATTLLTDNGLAEACALALQASHPAWFTNKVFANAYVKHLEQAVATHAL